MARLKAKVQLIPPTPSPAKTTRSTKPRKTKRDKQIANVIEMSRSKSDPTNEIDEFDSPEFHPDCEICQELMKD